MSREEHSDDALGQATKLLRDAEPAEFPFDAIAQGMRSRFQKVEAPLRIRRASWLSRIAASILVGIGLLGIGWVVFRSNPVVAFSLTAERLHEAHTISADLILNASGMELHGTLTYAAPGRFRIAVPGVPVEVVDVNAGKIVLLDSSNKSATLLNLDDTPSDSKRAEVDWIEKLRNVSHDAGKPLGVAIIDGARAAKFSVMDEGQEIVVWSDASTGEPVRIETKLVNGKDTVTMELDHLMINPSIDEQQFSVNIPPGYTTESGHVSAAAISEDDLVHFFKEYVSRTGSFPPSLVDFRRSVQRMMSPATRPAGGNPGASLYETVTRATRAVLFVNQLPQSADWHYNPAAKPGNANDPVFWYRAGGSTSYHIIHGDYHVEQTNSAPSVAGAETPIVQK
jgi:outer membrane lipoprotein-sorting protein